MLYKPSIAALILPSRIEENLVFIVSPQIDMCEVYETEELLSIPHLSKYHPSGGPCYIALSVVRLVTITHV